MFLLLMEQNCVAWHGFPKNGANGSSHWISKIVVIFIYSHLSDHRLGTEAEYRKYLSGVHRRGFDVEYDARGKPGFESDCEASNKVV